MNRWLKSVLKIFTFGVLLVLVILPSQARPAFAEIADDNGAIQLVRYIPSRQELIRMQSAGVKFLFVQLASYPNRFEARDLASFAGKLTLVIVAAQAPDSFQTDALNELKSAVYLFLQRIPDMYGIDRLATLKGDVQLYIMSHVYPSNMDVSNMNRISHPYTLAVSGVLPDAFAADRLNDLAASTSLILTTKRLPRPVDSAEHQSDPARNHAVRQQSVRPHFIHRSGIPGDAEHQFLRVHRSFVQRALGPGRLNCDTGGAIIVGSSGRSICRR